MSLFQYDREVSLQARSRALSEEKVAAKEAVLERQISEQTRLLTHLKSKRSLWGSEPEAGGGLKQRRGRDRRGRRGKKRPKKAERSQ